jgi:hypothetical protein
MAFRNDSGVQQFAIWAINNLAIAGEDVRRKLKKAGVIEVQAYSLLVYNAYDVFLLLVHVLINHVPSVGLQSRDGDSSRGRRGFEPGARGVPRDGRQAVDMKGNKRGRWAWREITY